MGHPVMDWRIGQQRPDIQWCLENWRCWRPESMFNNLNYTDALPSIDAIEVSETDDGNTLLEVEVSDDLGINRVEVSNSDAFLCVVWKPPYRCTVMVASVR